MKLFAINCGFYPLNSPIESNYSFYKISKNIIKAKKLIEKDELFIKNKMHIDTIVEYSIIDNQKLHFEPTNVKQEINVYGFKELKVLS